MYIFVIKIKSICRHLLPGIQNLIHFLFFVENVVKYSAPRGGMRDPEVDLQDISYDGILDGGQMRDGLGQLVDGLYGDDDYQKQLQGEHSGKYVKKIMCILKIDLLLPPTEKTNNCKLLLNLIGNFNQITLISISLMFSIF